MRQFAPPIAALVLAMALVCAPAAAQSAPPAEGRQEPLILEEDAALWELFAKGGFVMWVILLVSVGALALGIERGAALRSQVQVPKGLADELAARFSRGGSAAAMPLVKGKTSALARMLEAALLRVNDGRAAAAEAAGAAGERALYDMRRNIRPLGVAASITPLLGLLGTVWGMIKAFDRVSQGGLGRSAELAGGIGEALLTTGFGLIVAIPALVAYHFFRARSEDLIHLAEEETALFLDRAVSGGAPAGASTGPAPVAPRGKTSGATKNVKPAGAS